MTSGPAGLGDGDGDGDADIVVEGRAEVLPEPEGRGDALDSSDRVSDPVPGRPDPLGRTMAGDGRSVSATRV
ncbi:MAG TPA: hypothetical protein VGT61_14860 [Thermomicrobiales bacterium]|nr:hypothetical protein [Thermomicrobiales bacterium]